MKIAQAVSSRPVRFTSRYIFNSPIPMRLQAWSALTLDVRHLSPSLFHLLQDVVPPAYLDELSLLQDRIAPFSNDVAFNIIEKELGLPLNMIFSEITPEPVAAASLGQVRSLYHF